MGLDTIRLTAESAYRLRHRDMLMGHAFNVFNNWFLYRTFSTFSTIGFFTERANRLRHRDMLVRHYCKLLKYRIALRHRVMFQRCFQARLKETVFILRRIGFIPDLLSVYTETHQYDMLHIGIAFSNENVLKVEWNQSNMPLFKLLNPVWNENEFASNKSWYPWTQKAELKRHSEHSSTKRAPIRY